MGNPTVANALMDRLLHNGHRVELRGESIAFHALNLTFSFKLILKLAPDFCHRHYEYGLTFHTCIIFIIFHVKTT